MKNEKYDSALLLKFKHLWKITTKTMIFSCISAVVISDSPKSRDDGRRPTNHWKRLYITEFYSERMNLTRERRRIFEYEKLNYASVAPSFSLLSLSM